MTSLAHAPAVAALPAVSRWRGSLASARRSWLTPVVAVAVLVRVLATFTYLGGVDFHYDSYAYLHNAADLQPDLWHPIVFPFLLRVLSLFGHVSVIAVAQGAMGVATGGMVYVLGRRFGLTDGWAAVAAAPVLLDAWQIAVEQTVMSEPVFELLLVTGLLLLLAHPNAPWWRLVAGSTALSLACLTRTAALPVMALTVALLAVRRTPWLRMAAVVTFCALPLCAYAAAFSATYGPYELSGLNGRTLYGETATFADCSRLGSGPDLTVLCPAGPVSQRAGSNQYTWDVASPLNRLHLHGSDRVARTLELDRRAAAVAREVIHRQPLDYVRYVADTSARYFTVGRQARLQDFPQVAWQFLGRRHPAAVYDITTADAGFHGSRRPATRALPPTARLLRDYQRVVFTPGPILALAGLLGVGVALTRRRNLEAAFLALAGFAVVVMPSLAAGFDYRYLLPAMLLLPLSGALAASHLLQGKVLRRRGAISRWVVVVMVTVSVLALNVSHSGLIPASKQAAERTTPNGMTAELGQGLSVSVGVPQVRFARCRGRADATMRWWWSFDVPVHVVSSGPRHLVQGASVSVQGPRGAEQQPLTFRRGTGSRDVPTTVAGSDPGAIRGVSATAGFLLPTSSGLVRWSDSFGAGVAQWRLSVAARGLPAAGTPCYLSAETLMPTEA